MQLFFAFEISVLSRASISRAILWIHVDLCGIDFLCYAGFGDSELGSSWFYEFAESKGCGISISYQEEGKSDFWEQQDIAQMSFNVHD